MANDFLFGAYYAQIAFRDSEGYPMGQETAPDSVTNGTTTHAYLMRNIRSITAPQEAEEYAIDKGGQKVRTKVFMGISDFGEGEIEFSELDDVFASYVNGTTLITDTPSGWRHRAHNSNIENPPSFFLILTQRAERVSDTEDIVPKYVHHIYPNVQIRNRKPNATQASGEVPNPLVYAIIPRPAKRYITGRLLSALAFNVIGNSDTYFTIETDNPIALTTYVEAGTPAGAFTLGYLPLTDETDTSDKLLTQEGAADTFTDVNTSTGAVTTTAGTAGDKFVAMYEADLDSPTA